jgi:hypothetical protein
VLHKNAETTPDGWIDRPTLDCRLRFLRRG